MKTKPFLALGKCILRNWLIASMVMCSTLDLTLTARGNGTVSFANFFPGGVDAKVILPDGITEARAGYRAELVLVKSDGTLLPVGTTSFLNSPASIDAVILGFGYVNPITVTVPGVAPGTQAVVIMRAFKGASYECATIRGASNPITITLGDALGSWLTLRRHFGKLTTECMDSTDT